MYDEVRSRRACGFRFSVESGSVVGRTHDDDAVATFWILKGLNQAPFSDRLLCETRDELHQRSDKLFVQVRVEAAFLHPGQSSLDRLVRFRSCLLGVLRVQYTEEERYGECWLSAVPLWV